MTEQPTAKTMRCPGCKQIIETAKYGDHMLASNEYAHSNVGVITPTKADTPYPVVGASEAPTAKKEHWVMDWPRIWKGVPLKHAPFSVLIYSFFWFSIGLIVEWYYFVR